MNSELPNRFYRLLYFSPRPEDDERVCVGIIFKDEKNTFVDFDDKLEKAHCLAPDYGKKSLSFVLESIQANAEQATIEGKLTEFSPQFRLSAPRALLLPVDAKVRSVLRHKYLLKPKSFEHKKKEKGVERKIDQFLLESLRVPFSVIRRKTTIDDLLGFDASRQLPKDLVPKPVSRALISPSEIVLVDGVDLHLHSTDLLVHRVNRVAHTFWQYSKVKEMFPALKERHIQTAAIVFDGKEAQVEPSLKWRSDYAFHQFEKDADMTVKAGSHQQELAMKKSLRNLLPEDLSKP
jgi:hypothetical protein